MPSGSVRGSIFGAVQLHIAEDDCPPNVVDVRQMSAAAACSSDEISNFCDKFKVGSSLDGSCVVSPSVVGSSEMHDVTSVFAQCSSSSFDMHQDSLEKGKNNNNINNNIYFSEIRFLEFSEHSIFKKPDGVSLFL